MFKLLFFYLIVFFKSLKEKSVAITFLIFKNQKL